VFLLIFFTEIGQMSYKKIRVGKVSLRTFQRHLKAKSDLQDELEYFIEKREYI
jgi:hypothetical protein